MSLERPGAIAYVESEKQIIDYIAGKNPHLSKQVIEDIIKKIMVKALNDTIMLGKNWVNTYVPKRTGQLRDSLNKSLEASGKYKNALKTKLVAGTHLNYAKYVNKMRTSQVRHFGKKYGYAGYYGAPFKVLLNDPKAIAPFWGQFKMYLRKQLKNKVLEYIRFYTQMVGISRKPFTDKIKVKRA